MDQAGMLFALMGRFVKSFSPASPLRPNLSGDRFMASEGIQGQPQGKILMRVVLTLLVAMACAVPAGMTGCSKKPDGGKDGAKDVNVKGKGGKEGPIKVGILHSLTGTMAISEKSLKDAELMAIEEINAAGG